MGTQIAVSPLIDGPIEVFNYSERSSKAIWLPWSVAALSDPDISPSLIREGSYCSTKLTMSDFHCRIRLLLESTMRW